MNGKRPYDKCISRCSGNNRYDAIRVDDGHIEDIDIIKKIREKGLTQSLRRCRYCGSIWSEGFDGEKLIGIEDLETKKMHWVDF